MAKVVFLPHLVKRAWQICRRFERHLKDLTPLDANVVQHDKVRARLVRMMSDMEFTPRIETLADGHDIRPTDSLGFPSYSDMAGKHLSDAMLDIFEEDCFEHYEDKLVMRGADGKIVEEFYELPIRRPGDVEAYVPHETEAIEVPEDWGSW